MCILFVSGSSNCSDLILNERTVLKIVFSDFSIDSKEIPYVIYIESL